jgi:hypothetical protein
VLCRKSVIKPRDSRLWCLMPATVGIWPSSRCRKLSETGLHNADGRPGSVIRNVLFPPPPCFRVVLIAPSTGYPDGKTYSRGKIGLLSPLLNPPPLVLQHYVFELWGCQRVSYLCLCGGWSSLPTQTPVRTFENTPSAWSERLSSNRKLAIDASIVRAHSVQEHE